MTELWAALALLLCVTSGFVLWALWRPLPMAQNVSSRQQQVIILYRAKQAELEQELAAAQLSRSDYDQQLTEMQRTLLAETQTHTVADSQQVGRHSKGGLLLLFVSLALPLAGLLTYLELGAHAEYAQGVNMHSTRTISEQEQSLPELISGLEAELEEHKNNPEGWYLLANSYMQNEQLAQGITAFEQALGLVQPGSSQQAALLGQYAQALFFNDGEFTARVNQAIVNTMALDAQDVSALSLLGIQAFEAENYAAAVGFWQRALPRAGEGQGQASLQAGIASARQLLPAEARGASVSVAVSLANGLTFASQSQVQAVLFVYAKQAGVPMPLFATKLDPQQLPIDVTLTDAMALRPGTRLADYKELELMAHIALAGVPGKQAGDLVSQSITLVIASGEAVNLTIDQILQ